MVRKTVGGFSSHNLGVFIVVAALLSGLALSSPVYGSTREFWVSPEGDDAGPGTRHAPFRTLERARDAVRAVNGKQGPGKDIVVFLMGGTYRLKRALVLDARDSGRNGGDVVYRAAPGEHPVISGATPVTGWAPYDPDLGIYRAEVGPGETRQLYVNGRRATRAATEPYPAGFLPVFFQIAGIPLTGGIEFVPTDLNPGRWKNPSDWKHPHDVEAVIVTQWKMMRVPVDYLIPYPEYTPDPLFPDFKTGLLVMREPGWKNANVFLDASTNEPGIWSFWQVTRLENDLKFLDSPGEWYLDKEEHYLYYKPRPDEDIYTTDVELPLLDVLVEGAGEIASPVTNLRFEGLTFACATWMDPSRENGYVSDQSGFHLVGEDHDFNIIGHDPKDVRTPGNVQFRFARKITFSGCIFEHLGAVALDFDTGSQGNRIEGNLFEDISSAAIQLGGISKDDHHPEQPEQVTQDNLIENNLIREVGREFVDAAGIYVGFTRRTTIRHNTICGVPWSGIAVGWGWGLLDPGGYPGVPGGQRGQWGPWDTPTPNSGNKILHNRVDSFVLELRAGGAVYTTGFQGTSMDDALRIEGNVASRKRPGAGSNIFYTDGGSRYVRLEGNVSYDNPQGATDFGPPPRAGDPLPYSWIPSALNGIPYGTDRGGCRTYGDLLYVGNYWMNPCFFDICPFTENGISYPTDVRSKRTHEIAGEQDVPREVLKAAGVRKRPPSIPPDRWVLPPLLRDSTRPVQARPACSG